MIMTEKNTIYAEDGFSRAMRETADDCSSYEQQEDLYWIRLVIGQADWKDGQYLL